MGEILDSDWSRQNLLRCDWLGPTVALITTKGEVAVDVFCSFYRFLKDPVT